MTATGARLTGRPWPVEIRLKRAQKLLEVDFDDGHSFRLPAEYLRVRSPSAEVQGHGPGQAVLVAGKSEAGLIGIEPVGHYAVRLLFDDGHDTGLYSWDYLHRLGTEQETWWPAYLSRLAEAGLSRAPKPG